MGTSWVCRRRHGEVGIVEFGLNRVAVTDAASSASPRYKE